MILPKLGYQKAESVAQAIALYDDYQGKARVSRRGN